MALQSSRRLSFDRARTDNGIDGEQEGSCDVCECCTEWSAFAGALVSGGGSISWTAACHDGESQVTNGTNEDCAGDPVGSTTTTITLV